MAFTFPVGFSAASTRLGSYYNGDARTPQNPGGFDQYGYVENFVPALRDVTATGQGIAAFADYLNGTVSPLAQAAVDAATTAANAAGAAIVAATATGQDRTATGQDKTATAADRVVTGQDRTATGLDKVATAADRVATGQDKTATAADRVQTGQDKAAAAASATQAAGSANSLAGTSATSNTIGTGQKTFTTQAGKFFGAGTSVVIVSDSNPASQRMAGTVSGYSATTLTVNVTSTAGTGTYSDWTIRVSGAAGSNGASGWTPVFANTTRGADVVQRVVDWVGGSGTKPTTGFYVGPNGFVENIADATNVRGLAGAGGGNVNPTGSVDTNHVALFADATGNVIKSGGLLAEVATSGKYVDLDLTGAPEIPTTPADIGAAEAAALTAHVADTGNPHAVTKTQVGLGNADNTSDANKPVSTATGSALALKAPLASPVLTGTPAAPTAAVGSNTTQLATTAFVAAAIGALIDGAPGAIDTINELAAALGDDPNFATTITNALAGKQPLDSDLTAIAALTTQAFGRSVLSTADAAALRTLAGLVLGTNVQAYDADLAAIAALTTTTFGRGLLTLADAAALRTAAGLGTAATANTGDFATAAQGVLAAAALAAASKATAADIIAGTEDAEYTTPKGHADSEAFITFAANALSLAALRNGKITLAAITTFAAPTSYGWEGKSGALEITSGGFAGSFNVAYDFGPDGPPTLAAKGYVYYQVKPGMTGLKCSYVECA